MKDSGFEMLLDKLEDASKWEWANSLHVSIRLAGNKSFRIFTDGGFLSYKVFSDEGDITFSIIEKLRLRRCVRRVIASFPSASLSKLLRT